MLDVPVAVVVLVARAFVFVVVVTAVDGALAGFSAAVATTGRIGTEKLRRLCCILSAAFFLENTFTLGSSGICGDSESVESGGW